MFSGIAFFPFRTQPFFFQAEMNGLAPILKNICFIILLLGVNVLQRTLFLCHFSVHGKCSLWAPDVDVESGDSVAERESHGSIQCARQRN